MNDGCQEEVGGKGGGSGSKDKVRKRWEAWDEKQERWRPDRTKMLGTWVMWKKWEDKGENISSNVGFCVAFAIQTLHDLTL